MSNQKQSSDHAQTGPGVSASTAAGSGLKMLKSVMFSIGSVMGNRQSGQPNAENRGKQQQN